MVSLIGPGSWMSLSWGRLLLTIKLQSTNGNRGRSQQRGGPQGRRILAGVGLGGSLHLWDLGTHTPGSVGVLVTRKVGWSQGEDCSDFPYKFLFLCHFHILSVSHQRPFGVQGVTSSVPLIIAICRYTNTSHTNTRHITYLEAPKSLLASRN